MKKELKNNYQIVKKGKIQLGDILFDKRISQWAYSGVTNLSKSIDGTKVLGDGVYKYYGVARKK